MRLLAPLSIVIYLYCVKVWAKPVKLVYGGDVNLNEREWEVIDTKSMFEHIPQSFVHKKHSDLKGWLMGGAPDLVPKCTKKTKHTFNICTDFSQRDRKIFHQIILTRKVESNAYQNYLISFSYEDSQSKRFDPLVKSFISDIERSSE